MLERFSRFDVAGQDPGPKGRRPNVLGGIVLGMLGVFYGLLTFVILL